MSWHTTLRSAPVVVLALSLFLTLVSAQLASIFDDAQIAPNCRTWSTWGECLWLKGARLRNKKGLFDQLTPQCQRSLFYSTVKRSYGKAMDNVYNYLANVTLDDQPCGFCSFRQSCGYRCDTKTRGTQYINRIFVAEELCTATQLNGNKQDKACFSDPSAIPPENAECKVWPNRKLPLPSVDEQYKEIVYSIDLVNCVKSTDKGKPVCRCCCTPYFPDPSNNFACVLRKN